MIFARALLTLLLLTVAAQEAHAASSGQQGSGQSGLCSYTPVAPLTGTECWPVNQNGVTKTATANAFFKNGVTGPGSSVVNDLALWSNTQGTVLKDGGKATLTVANIAALRLLGTSGNNVSNVLVPGYTASGDGGGGLFNFNPLDTTTTDNNCTIFVDGANRRWYRNLNGTPITPLMCGAKGDGTTDDTAAFQNAVNAAQNNTLLIGENIYLLTSTVTSAGSIKIVGPGPNTSAGLRAGTLNMNLLSLSAGNNLLSGFHIDMSTVGQNTSGKAITTASSGNQNTTIEDVVIDGPCLGIELSGNVTHVNRVRINNLFGASCIGIRVGHNTTNAATLTEINSTTIASDITRTNSAGVGLEIEDAGGLYLLNTDVLFSVIGTRIFPGLNQRVIYLFSTNTELGDTVSGDGLLIDTADSTAVVKSLYFDQSWTSNSSGGNGIHIQNSASGSVNAIHFSNHRAYINANNGMSVSGTIGDISVSDSAFCGNAVVNNNSQGILIDAGVTSVKITNNRIGSACEGFTAAPEAWAINLAGNPSETIITGNDLTNGGSLGNINNFPSGSSVVTNNVGVDTVVVSAASATTLAAPINPIFKVTGSTAVTTISGFWNNRQMTMITSGGALSFNTGGNICNAVTSAAAMASVLATWDSADTCWALK